MMKQFALLMTLSFAGLTVTSCVPLAAGAAGGYLLHKKGYRVQNPVKKADVKLQAPVKKPEVYQNPPIYDDGTYPPGY